MFVLHAFQALIHITYFTAVFTKNYNIGFAAKQLVKIVTNYDARIYLLAGISIDWLYFFHCFSFPLAFAV